MAVVPQPGPGPASLFPLALIAASLVDGAWEEAHADVEEVGMPSVYARAVRRAAEIAGGVNQLSAEWHVPVEELMSWLEGTRPVPQEFFLRAVDIITEYDVEELNPPGNELQPRFAQ